MDRRNGNLKVQHPPENLREEARAWLTLFYTEETSDQDRARFSAWLRQSDLHAEAFAEAEKLWGQLAYASETLTEQSDFQQPTEPKDVNIAPLQKPKALFLARKTVIAAIAACFLAVVGGLSVTWEAPTSVSYYQTALGEVKEVTLDDGTKLTLNAAANAEVHMSDKERQVLLKGGGFFDVVPDQGRPFRVVVAGTEVRVLGTAFDVWEGPYSVRVSVTEGAVEVAGKSAEAREKSETDTPVRLTAGEEVVTTLSGWPDKVKRFNPEATLAWREGHLIYIDAPLVDIVADANRYRKKKIIILDKRLEGLRITTAFRADQTDKMLAGVTATNPLLIEETKEVVYVRPLKE